MKGKMLFRLASPPLYPEGEAIVVISFPWIKSAWSDWAIWFQVYPKATEIELLGIYLGLMTS